jgi:hypothetical protein
MRKLIISILWGSAWNTARFIFPLGILLALVVALSSVIWSTLSIILVGLIILVMISSIYLSLFPAKRDELSEKQKKIYDNLKDTLI